MSAGAVFSATAISAGIATLCMAFFANYPVALASGMGLNAFFAFTVCGAMGYDYKQASPIFWCREGQELIGQTKCSSEIFQANDIENAVFQALKKELSLLGSLYGDIKKEEQSLKEASRKASRRKTSMEQELKNLKGEKMRMYEEYAAGTLSLDNYKNKKQEYDRKIAEVQDKIEQSKAEEAAQSVVPGTVRVAAEQAENFLHGTRLTASMVSAFIENVYVH